VHHNFFLQNLGVPMLFQTISSAWVCATTTAKYVGKKRRDQEFCKGLVDSEDGINYLIEYFNIHDEYDGDKIKSMFKYYLKKKLVD